ncbi:unnamed protein product [Urochloa humidicola]
MEAAVAYLLLLPLATCAVLLLLQSAFKPFNSKVQSNGVLLRLPPSPPAVPVVGPLLWLLRARNRLEPAIRELHRRQGPVLTLRFLSPRPAIFVSGRAATHRALVQRGHRAVPSPQQRPEHRQLRALRRALAISAAEPHRRRPQPVARPALRSGAAAGRRGAGLRPRPPERGGPRRGDLRR